MGMWRLSDRGGRDMKAGRVYAGSLGWEDG